MRLGGESFLRGSISMADPLVFGLGGFVLLGRTVRVELTLTDPQSGVLPLHYARHAVGQSMMQTFAFALSDVQMVWEVGFEPTSLPSGIGFTARRLQPLGHSHTKGDAIHLSKIPECARVLRPFAFSAPLKLASLGIIATGNSPYMRNEPSLS